MVKPFVGLLFVLAASLAGQTGRSYSLAVKVQLEGATPLIDRFYRPMYGRTTMSVLFETASDRVLAPVMVDGTAGIRVAAGSAFWVSMTDLPFGIYVKSIRSGSRDLLTNLLEVSDLRTPPEIQVILTTTRPDSEPKGFTARGRATGPLDLYPEGLELRVGPALPTSPRRFERVPIPRDGVVEIRDIPPGRYRWEMQTSKMELVGNPGLGWFTVTNADTNLEFPVAFRMSIRGRIQADKADLPSLTVWATKQNGLVASYRSQRGLIDMTLQEGSYSFAVEDIPAGYAVTSISYGTLDLLKSRLTVNQDTPSAELVVVLSVAK